MKWAYCDAVNLALDLKRDGDSTDIDTLVAEIWNEMKTENMEVAE